MQREVDQGLEKIGAVPIAERRATQNREARGMERDSFSWAKAASVGIFVPMAINVLVLAMYLISTS
jgi:predicted dehydrogenase